MKHIIMKKYLDVEIPLAIKFAEAFELTNVIKHLIHFLLQLFLYNYPLCIQAAHLINIGSRGSMYRIEMWMVIFDYYVQTHTVDFDCLLIFIGCFIFVYRMAY